MIVDDLMPSMFVFKKQVTREAEGRARRPEGALMACWNDKPTRSPCDWYRLEGTDRKAGSDTKAVYCLMPDRFISRPDSPEACREPRFGNPGLTTVWQSKGPGRASWAGGGAFHLEQPAYWNRTAAEQGVCHGAGCAMGH